MIPRRGSARRTAIDRWIASLNPMFDVITSRAKQLKLGEPKLSLGPTFMGSDRFDDGRDRIRKGQVWWIDGKNAGFHVDFMAGDILIEAWCGVDRRVSLSVSGKVTECTLKRDLKAALTAAGLTDLAKSEEVRGMLPSARRTARAPAETR